MDKLITLKRRKRDDLLSRRGFLAGAVASISAPLLAAILVAQLGCTNRLVEDKNPGAVLASREDIPAVEKNTEKKARVLIVTGRDYPGHLWRETAPVLAADLRADPRLDVRVVEDPKILADKEILDRDAIVLHFMNWEQPDPGEQARANLKQFVEGGKGLVLIHFACGAFQDWPEFRNLAGRSYDPKLRGHDPYGSFRVEIVNREHPVTKGLEGFETVDELYTCLAGDRPIDILATSRSKVDGKDYPMAFAFSYGKGRVFHSPLGHDVTGLRKPGVAELLRRGCAWAAGLPSAAEPAAAGAGTGK